uniref:Uncharacterized protein n=1 Tax=Panagrellus redivivus TaxID=6233 RepID=A0A7E4W1W2_PANRE
MNANILQVEKKRIHAPMVRSFSDLTFHFLLFAHHDSDRRQIQQKCHQKTYFQRVVRPDTDLCTWLSDLYLIATRLAGWMSEKDES